ncbi:tetratricopeptide repeat protein [Vibrio europaeus]|uniref:tetratricopeptide repeat protein n=1 Tax=Vibrio europaeus TaxID=300876 RepID=UPI0039E027DE
MKLSSKLLIFSVLGISAGGAGYMAFYPYTLTKGYDYYHRSNFAKAEKIFHKLADDGNAEAQTQLAFMYIEGKGHGRDPDLALKWLRKAADSGYAEAQYRLAGLYYHAVKKSPESKIFAGIVTMNTHARSRNIVEHSDSEAEKWYKKAALQGHLDAQHSLGEVYEYGESGIKNIEDATVWYQRAAKQGSLKAITKLGTMYHDGYGIVQSENYAQAMKLYRQAAEQGYSNAQVRLGAMLANGENSAKDYAGAEMWFKKAANQNDVAAMYDLGIINQIQGNHTEAMNWYQQAAERGNIKAKNKLLIYKGGDVLAEDKAAFFTN